MSPQFDIDVRRARGFGWTWRILRFSHGSMQLAATGRSPFRWMAHVDAKHFLNRHRHGVLAGARRVTRESDLD